MRFSRSIMRWKQNVDKILQIITIKTQIQKHKCTCFVNIEIISWMKMCRTKSFFFLLSMRHRKMCFYVRVFMCNRRCERVETLSNLIDSKCIFDKISADDRINSFNLYSYATENGNRKESESASKRNREVKKWQWWGRAETSSNSFDIHHNNSCRIPSIRKQWFLCVSLHRRLFYAQTFHHCLFCRHLLAFACLDRRTREKIFNFHRPFSHTNTIEKLVAWIEFYSSLFSSLLASCVLPFALIKIHWFFALLGRSKNIYFCTKNKREKYLFSCFVSFSLNFDWLAWKNYFRYSHDIQLHRRWARQ